MKRYLIFALPILATFIALGVGLLVVRTQSPAIKTRFGAVGKAVAGVVDEVAEEIGEVLE